MTPQNRALGLFSAFAVICIWSGFIVVARLGVTSGLTAFDITGLRLLVAGTVAIPFALFNWPRHLPWYAQALIALTGPGILYSMAMYQGLDFASAAYGGVFGNGPLPIFTMLFSLLLIGTRPNAGQVIGAIVIISGGLLVAWRGLGTGGENLEYGIALFLLGSATVSLYSVFLRRWQITPWQVLALVNIPNAVIYLPVWYFALPSTMSEATTGAVLLQAVYQGLGPGTFAAVFFALASIHLGPTPTAGFSAAVPATAAVLAVPVLGETPTPLEWLGVAVVTLGLGLIVRSR